ncbi:hypothetical protein BDM02DRAFT_3191714 [Thelephora ganbajun]|uniref:Uncharacterized protein n=1 Tax=Thelephora ganbajun TaxID=370292 RepID=A0ACB6Z115_THEGA|nr:hypothetical protein BDM02DRAFT_3191714 [Thelephora ganbajun]
MLSTLAQSEIPSTLPPLPPATVLPWSAEIIQAHCGLVSAFVTSYGALNLDESDPIWLGHHLKQAETFMTSIVDVLSIQMDNPLPPKYIETIREAVKSLVDGLKVALGQATSAERSSVSQIKVITTERSGKRGWPRKVISEAFLHEAFRPGRNISVSKLASSLGVHRNMLKNYMHQYHITRQPFSAILDSSLDVLVRQYRDEHPKTGIRYLRGHLLQQGMWVQREWITASLTCVDDVAKVILHNTTIK